MITIKSSNEVELMRAAGRIVGKTHEMIQKHIKPGITTLELDKIAEDYIRSNDAIPSFKGYRGFPGSICASVNEEVVHGIPSLRKLKNGDIISVDIGAIYKGYHGDSANTYGVGEISHEAQKLIEVTKNSFFEGMRQAKTGKRLFDISAAIQDYIESKGYSVVREFVGHGIGKEMHEDPQIPNYGTAGKGPRLAKGMTFAVEPMVNVGKKDVKVLSNGWTVVTKDLSLSAHYEHTLLITDGTPEYLTML